MGMESCESSELAGLVELEQQLRAGLEQMRKSKTAEAAVEVAKSVVLANAGELSRVLDATRPEVLRRALEKTAEQMGVEVGVLDPEKLRRLLGEFSPPKKPLPPKES